MLCYFAEITYPDGDYGTHRYWALKDEDAIDVARKGKNNASVMLYRYLYGDTGDLVFIIKL